EAYDTLSDPERRKQYDSFGRAFRPGQGPGPGGGFQGFDFGGNAAGFDLGDLFGGLFNRGGRGGPAGGPRRGADVEAQVRLFFEDARRGLNAEVAVQHVTL